jgi:hypothetical protein
MTAAEIFAAHAAACARCRTVDLERPATLAQACLEGSRLLKDAISAGKRDAALERARAARRRS